MKTGMVHSPERNNSRGCEDEGTGQIDRSSASCVASGRDAAVARHGIHDRLSIGPAA
jgi:hypothetical protein